jgi:Na+/H+ antiporter NhaC
LIGAILGGATFGDSISSISDTTIASAGTQGADIGGVVKARLKYVLPAAGVAFVAAFLYGGSARLGAVKAPAAVGSPRALPMVIVPLTVIGLRLERRHLIEGLLRRAACNSGWATRVCRRRT